MDQPENSWLLDMKDSNLVCHSFVYDSESDLIVISREYYSSDRLIS